jgi:hypothetical protein
MGSRNRLPAMGWIFALSLAATVVLLLGWAFVRAVRRDAFL